MNITKSNICLDQDYYSRGKTPESFNERVPFLAQQEKYMAPAQPTKAPANFANNNPYQVQNAN